MMRHPKTTQESRYNGKRCNNGVEEFEGFVVRVRAKRSEANLPDSYWDMWVYHEKGWKNYRRTQYK